MFLINNYDRKRVSIIKGIFKDLFFVLYYIYSRIFHKGKTVLFYPDYPSKRAVLYKVFRSARFNITNNPKLKYQISVFWSEKTIRNHDSISTRINLQKPMINYHFTDSSKAHVENNFSSVFNRSTFVDPLTHKGKCVKKSNNNAVHDGLIIDCPVKKVDEDSVYQIVIDNVLDSKYVEDLRIPIINNSIHFLYVKYKRIEKRFGTFKHSLTQHKEHQLIENPLELLSQDEINKILRFSKMLNMDYGELDVLRDQKSGAIYIIDANNTPHGPTGFSPKNKKTALDILKKELLRSAHIN